MYSDRTAAGQLLARELRRLQLHPPIIVLALPRGGVPVAVPVARQLGAVLDVMVVRKLGMPGHPEFAIGAIAPGTVFEPSPSAALGVSSDTLRALMRREQLELLRREKLYRSGRPPLNLHGRTVVLVDDGLATGATMLAAIRAARRFGARTVVVAAPVASDQAVDLIDAETDAIVVLEQPSDFHAVGQFYERFEQLQDAAVCDMLADYDADAASRDSTVVRGSRRSTS